MICVVMTVFTLAFSSCKDDSVQQEAPQTVVIETEFSNGTDGWNAVYAAYPEADSTFYELVAGMRPLPTPLDRSRSSFLLSGNNHSDALQMFLVKRLQGLKPDTKYTVETEVELASKYPNGSVGIGGSPGNSVYLVARYSMLGYVMKTGQNGWKEMELMAVVTNPQSTLNMDLGDVSIPSTQYVYELITRKKSSGTAVVQSDAQGRLWAIIGTWSGFEGISSLHYTKIKISFTTS